MLNDFDPEHDGHCDSPDLYQKLFGKVIISRRQKLPQARKQLGVFFQHFPKSDLTSKALHYSSTFQACARIKP